MPLLKLHKTLNNNLLYTKAGLSYNIFCLIKPKISLLSLISTSFYFVYSVYCPQACRDFLTLAQTHSKRWQKALQAEREQRVRLEEALEQLAKQHNHLERAFRGASQAHSSADNKGEGDSQWITLICFSFCCSLIIAA